MPEATAPVVAEPAPAASAGTEPRPTPDPMTGPTEPTGDAVGVGPEGFQPPDEGGPKTEPADDFVVTDRLEPVASATLPKEEPDTPPETPKVEDPPKAEAEPTSESKPEVKPEAPAKPETVPWDQKRQEADQRAANLEKENRRLKATLAAQEAGPARDAATIAAELAELQANPLDALADDDDRNERLNQLTALNAELANAKVGEAQRQDDSVALDQILDRVCAEMGAEHRNAIVAGLNRVWQERRYGPGHWPSSEQVEDIARLEAAKAQASAKPTPKPTSPAAPAATPSDPGTGGAPAPTGPRNGAVRQFASVDEAAAYLAAHGGRLP